MSKWVDAEWLKKEIRKSFPSLYMRTEINTLVNLAPTIDIVHCGECVKANTENCSYSYWDDDWGVWRIGYKGDNWFCSEGERIDNDD